MSGSQTTDATAHDLALAECARNGTICSTCRWWEQPVARPGLHQCLNPVHAAIGFIATYRHEACHDWEAFA